MFLTTLSSELRFLGSILPCYFWCENGMLRWKELDPWLSLRSLGFFGACSVGEVSKCLYADATQMPHS